MSCACFLRRFLSIASFAALVGVLHLALLGAQASAAESGWVVRVLSEEAEVRTGPSFTFRAVYRARRGEILEVLGRAPKDHWFRVELPDGTYGWILGAEVLPLAVDPTAPPPPSLWSRFEAAVFSPPPLMHSDVSLSFSAGFLGGEGLILFRPAWIVAPNLGLEAYVGETVGEFATVLYYGAGASYYLWPHSPLTPFLGMGGGGTTARPKVDQVASSGAATLATANAGGGLLVALKKRVTLRFDARHHLRFDPNQIQSAQEYSGGLVVLF